MAEVNINKITKIISTLPIKQCNFNMSTTIFINNNAINGGSINSDKFIFISGAIYLLQASILNIT